MSKRTSSLDLPPGTVFEYTHAHTHKLAVVLESGRALLSVNEEGQRERIAARSVNYQPITTLEPNQSGATYAASLAALRTELQNLVERADVEELWELVTLEDEPQLPNQSVAELLFDDGSTTSQYAAFCALRTDDVFFKLQRDLTWSPRPEHQVESLKHQRAREREAREAHLAMLDVILQAASADDPNQARNILNAYEHADHLQKPLQLLQEYAIAGDDFALRSKAIHLLEELEARAQTPLRLASNGSARAFDLLLKLGHLSPYENLWLRRSRLSVSFPEPLSEHAHLLMESLPYLHATSLQDLDLDSIPQHRGRRDLTHLRVFTIDDASTRDIDDGISIQRISPNLVTVGVHIADPAAIIPLGSPLDEEARKRGTSVYEPVQTIPMFPPLLSESAMSLVEGVLRPAISFLITLDTHGTITAFEPCLSWVRVRQRFDFDTADQVMLSELPHELASDLDELYQISQALYQKRLEAGAVFFQTPEVKIRVRGDLEHGTLQRLESITFVPSDRTSPSRDAVQELMVLSGNALARYCRDTPVPILYRIQPPPDQHEDEQALSGAILDEFESFTMRRRMKRSLYSLQSEAHFGLGLDAYTQATSPIRRYADLITHHQLRAHLLHDDLPLDRDGLSAILTQIDGLSGEASVVERESRRFWTLVALEKHLGETLPATVIHHPDGRSDRATVRLEHFNLYTSLALTQTQSPGDTVYVRVDDVHARSGRLTLRTVQPS